MNTVCKILPGIFLALNLVGCSSEKPEREEKFDIRKQSIEEKAPAFVLKDLKGNDVKLSDYRGKIVLLVFGTTWCPYCRAEIPRLKEIYSRYRGKGLEIVNIDIQESEEKVSSFTTKHKIPYKVLLDKTGGVARAYKVRGVPTKILVGKDGTILCRECRSVDILLEKQFGETT
jgi:peroxiredoxin